MQSQLQWHMQVHADLSPFGTALQEPQLMRAWRSNHIQVQVGQESQKLYKKVLGKLQRKAMAVGSWMAGPSLIRA